MYRCIFLTIASFVCCFKSFSSSYKYDSSDIIESYLSSQKTGFVTNIYVSKSFLSSFLLTEQDSNKDYQCVKDLLSKAQYDSLVRFTRILSSTQSISEFKNDKIKIINDSEAKVIQSYQSLIIRKVTLKRNGRKKTKILDNPYDSSILYRFSPPIIFNSFFCILRVDRILGINNGTNCIYLLEKNKLGRWDVKKTISCTHL